MSLSLVTKRIIISLCFLAALVMHAQEVVHVERSTDKVILEGSVYYIHVVRPGQTLYSIARAYHISQKEIAIENPGVVSGLQIGQSLKIPVEPTLREEVDTSRPRELEVQGRLHLVRAGETLYSISREYGFVEEDLQAVNPGLRADNLKVGQQIRIPESAQPPETEEKEEIRGFNEEGYIYHEVKRRETLYSLARYYQVSEEAIVASNPELGWGGPKTGQVIRIPDPNMNAREVFDTDYVEEETAYDYEELARMGEDRRRTYRIAYFIPFNFRESEPLDSLLKDVENASRRARITERYTMEQRIPQSVPFLEFFQGSLLAIDSMRQMGMKMEVRFFDTRRSLDRTRSILEEEDLEDYDLFIGPFYPFNLELVSMYSRRHRIPLVTPFYDESKLVKENPYFFQLSPSLEKSYREAAKLVASKHSSNIVYVRQEDTTDVDRHALFKELIFDGFDDYRPQEPVVFKEVVLSLERIISLEETQEIIHSLSTDKANLVVVPSGNVSLASPVVSALNYQLDHYQIEILGSPHWMGTDFSSIDYRDFHNLRLIFYSSFWKDYSDPQVEQFLASYRRYFHNEPYHSTKKGISYGIVAYDMSLYFLNALRTYGPRFILELDDYDPDLVLGSYHFERISSSGGFENTSMRFYQFSTDWSIQEIEVPDLPDRRRFFWPRDPWSPNRRRPRR